ncbi:hypothetical protein [Nocardia farcinica]|uniref:hypothetical protein n=1 Tax=Nocardia farcinica TaxID=37329 RepID=UPI001892FBFB|nr:hypothetical protein [Nocardia farcinica]MBF6233955.1 hypothetical protein [Nocardia farcinica]
MTEVNATEDAQDESAAERIEPPAAEPTEQEPTDDEPKDGDEPPAREAAKYRRRLRETETERDALAARVEALQRAEVERIASAGQVKPAALWASGAELAGLVREDGTVDPDKVDQALTAARESLGIPEPRGRLVVPREGHNSRPSSSRSSMASVIRGGE